MRIVLVLYIQRTFIIINYGRWFIISFFLGLAVAHTVHKLFVQNLYSFASDRWAPTEREKMRAFCVFGTGKILIETERLVVGANFHLCHLAGNCSLSSFGTQTLV